MVRKANGYDESSIRVLNPVEAVKQNLGMYIGANDSNGIFQIAKEIIDNSVDEASAGFNDLVGVVLDNKTITIFDHGRGIPVGKSKQTGRSTLIEVFATLHAGGKKGGEAYKKGSIGTHGVGGAVVNFLSTQFEAYTYREENGGWHYIRFEKGELVGTVSKKKPPRVAGRIPKLGTIVTFTPDPSVFTKTAKLNTKQISDYLHVLSYLVPGAKFALYEEGKEPQVFIQKNGLSDYLRDLLEQEKAEAQGKEFIVNDETFSLALQWSDAADEIFLSYVNGSHTKDGGTHVKAVQDAITKALEPLKGKREYTPTDLRTGLIGVLNIHLASPSFDSQTKNRLVTESAYAQVYEPLLKHLTAFFAKNKTLANDIIRRAAEVRELRTAFQANKKATAALRSTKARATLPAKLLSSTTKNPKERELYIVEGDSAGGTAKHARDGRYQEVLKLRGKILNAYGPQGHKVFDTEKDRNEVLDIMRAIGYDGDPTKPLKLRVGKILILTDPDPDGKHIALLIANLFQKTLPKAIIDKYLYIVKAPLFMYSFNENKKVFGDTVEDVRKKLGKTKLDPKKLTRIKGFGEVNPNVLKQVAFDPKSPDRHIVRITELKQGKEAEFLEIVGEKAHGRRQLLGL